MNIETWDDVLTVISDCLKWIELNESAFNSKQLALVEIDVCALS